MESVVPTCGFWVKGCLFRVEVIIPSAGSISAWKHAVSGLWRKTKMNLARAAFAPIICDGLKILSLMFGGENGVPHLFALHRRWNQVEGRGGFTPQRLIWHRISTSSVWMLTLQSACTHSRLCWSDITKGSDLVTMDKHMCTDVPITAVPIRWLCGCNRRNRESLLLTISHATVHWGWRGLTQPGFFCFFSEFV